jgi:hypothetical protein
MTYAESTKRLPDFEVRYRFYSATEGGRKTGPPFQHYRCDWAYDGDDISITGIYMIYPEFVAADGSVLPEDVPVPVSGTATMWILSPELQSGIHARRVKEGVRGFFMEGGHRVAEATVTRIIGVREC